MDRRKLDLPLTLRGKSARPEYDKVTPEEKAQMRRSSI
jgi:hypothetical protein